MRRGSLLRHRDIHVELEGLTKIGVLRILLWRVIVRGKCAHTHELVLDISVLDTRPIYHQSDAAIRGHVFCGFLGLLLLHELRERMAGRAWVYEWERLKEDLNALEEIRVKNHGPTFWIRSRTRGAVGKAFQDDGVRLGSTVRFEDGARRASHAEAHPDAEPKGSAKAATCPYNSRLDKNFTFQTVQDGHERLAVRTTGE